MEWTPGGDTSNVEDRRGDSGGGFGFGGGGIGGGGIGIVGFLVLLVISLVTGHNFLGSMLGGGGGGQSMQQTQSVDDGSSLGATGQTSGQAGGQRAVGKDRDTQLIVFAFDSVQKFWENEFQQTGRPYKDAKLVIFSGSTYSGCGGAQASTGPFYCPGDGKVYIDESFWNELKQFGGSTADFAQSYVIAHEMGHHVQDELGVEKKVESLMQSEPGERNHLSVDLELQADCYGGVWAHSAQQQGIIDPGDVDAALSAVSAVGDDHLEKMSGRAVSPESWTHGSSAQRQHWFQTGFQSGDPKSCDTFGSGGQ